MSLDNAVIYDTECFPNYWSLDATGYNHEYWLSFEISPRRNDIQRLYQWFQFLQTNQMYMIGFNNLMYDYPMIHSIWMHPGDTTNESLYRKNNEIIGSQDRFGQQIWQSQRFAPQIDLLKVHHMDNKAKIQSLKGLEFNMRSHTVLESSVAFGSMLSEEQIEREVIPYGRHDVRETKRFAQISREMLEFREGLKSQLTGDIMNFNDTKIGKEMMAQRLGEDVCYERVQTASGYNRKVPRQTIRRTIPLADIIFPYVYFEHPEFNRVLNWMKSQTLQPSDLDAEDVDARASTKGVFSGVNCTVNGFTFSYGTGGIHGSVTSQHIKADDEYMIFDVDVASLYPSIAIANKLFPEHLGIKFVEEYAKLPAERKQWQKLKGKKCVEANRIKLAGNGTYGGSNDQFSFLYDPKFTMTITINGQLMISMLAEWLMKIPTVQLIQANTDGITMKMHRSVLEQAKAVCAKWETYVGLTLEFAEYSDMWIRDVNAYVARDTEGKVKLKGPYWYPDPMDYSGSITGAQPSAWHKDLSAPIIAMAANAAMIHGLDPAIFIALHTNPFDFMLRAKVPRGSLLYIGDRQVQRLTRYYMSHDGAQLRKVSPPTGEPGQYKRKNGVSEFEFQQVMNIIGPGVHDERIHTKNKSKYEEREMSMQAGWNVAECNVASDFRFDNLNQRWYVEEAKKLIIR